MLSNNVNLIGSYRNHSKKNHWNQ